LAQAPLIGTPLRTFLLAIAGDLAEDGAAWKSYRGSAEIRVKMPHRSRILL